MSQATAIFDSHIAFDPAGDFEAFLKQAPARWVVYLLADEQDQPVQLLCVKNLRASLRRRLSGEETITLSKRVNYRQIVRHVYWRRVDSAFEADWIYLEAARRLFPASYQGMVGFRPAWFIHVNPEANFPRYIKTIDPTVSTGRIIGPVEDKHAAARLIELAEDAFDLCRYYNILIEAPNGRACAYKEMGKCPAPCDGLIGMDLYRKMIADSTAAIVEPQRFIVDLKHRMQEAAGRLQFELAARLKAKIEQLSKLGCGAFRHARLLGDFRFLSLQRGPRAEMAKIFLITVGGIEEILGLIGEPRQPAEILQYVLACSAIAGEPITPEGIERIGLVSHHLFSSKQTHGVFLPLASIDESSFVTALRALRKQKVEEQVEGEGVIKELQSMG